MLPLCVVSAPHPNQECTEGRFGCSWWMVLSAGFMRGGFLASAVLPCFWLCLPNVCPWGGLLQSSLLQPGCSCRCWRSVKGCQAHLARWQLLTKAPIQNLPMLWVFPLSHQPNPATERTAGKTPIDCNEMRIRPSETSFQFIS